MTFVEKEQIKENMVEQIGALKQEIRGLEDKVQPIVPDCSLGDLGRFEIMQEQNVFLKALESSKQRLGTLQHLLYVIDGDTNYGTCKECGEEILYDRLLLLPESNYCTHCAKIKN